jgi:hypothetical protein
MAPKRGWRFEAAKASCVDVGNSDALPDPMCEHERFPHGPTTVMTGLTPIPPRRYVEMHLRADPDGERTELIRQQESVIAI